MKTIEIYGKNYFGSWDKTRTACRGLIMDGDKLLLSYETVTDTWMIPGGGLEENESDRECCLREIAEETGVLAELADCVLEIDEYYEDCRFVSRYFIGKPVGHTEIKLTARERKAGMEPRWICVEEIRAIFARHASYADTDEMKRGVYQREHTALTELLP